MLRPSQEVPGISTEKQLDQQTLGWRHSPTGVLWRTKAWAWRVVPSPLVRLASHCLRFWYALRLEGRSFYGHIQTLLAKRHWGVDLGPLYENLPGERLFENKRTAARSAGMEALVSEHPWASSIDLQIFLEGFHAGEQYALHMTNRQERTDEIAP